MPLHRARHRPQEPKRSRLTSDFVWKIAGTRQYNSKFGEMPGFRLDIDSAPVLFYDDVVAHRKSEPGSFARGLGREERVEHLLPYVGGDSGAVIANPDFHAVAEIPGRRAEDRVEA